jgi:ComF family protein
MRASLVYGGSLQDAIHRFKYQGKRQLSGPLAGLLGEFCPGDLEASECVVPVPLHPQRLRERGFNQAALIARGLGRGLELGALARIRPTAPQRGLSADERRENLRAAFRAFPAQVRGRAMLLVDDVLTTGSTFAAAAEALRDAGARSVQALALARALPDSLEAAGRPPESA